MYQSSPRTNFLDALLDPKAIAILASIALHASIGASLPFFTQPEKEGKKAGPTTVKVVELTPSELQRIPQIPQAPTVPAPQASPPVAQPTTAPVKPAIAPSTTPQFSTAPQAIPFSPIRLPKEVTSPKPLSGKKKEQAARQKQANTPNFDPEDIFKPSPTPSKSPIPKGAVKPKTVVMQPSPQKTTPPTKPKTATSPTTQVSLPPDDDGGNKPPTSTPVPVPGKTQQPAGIPATTTTPTSTPKPQSTTQSSGDPTGDNSNSGFYGRYQQVAANRLLKYKRDIPELVIYPPQTIIQPYPPKTKCTKTKQSPFIVYVVAFDKVPLSRPDDILAPSLTPAIDDPSIYGNKDDEDLYRKMFGVASEAATTADKNRPIADRGKRVLYQYKVQLDPATCKY